MEKTAIVSVTELNLWIKDLLDSEEQFQDIWVKGEISNFKHHTSGHMYFTLKDPTGALKAVMFRTRAGRLKFRPENGMKVLARGSVSVYERDGAYQLYVNDMEPDGVGALYLAFEQLKAKLEAEGLFDPARKRPLPYLPERVGIVTSPTGAALQDMLNILGRRFPNLSIIIAPTLVQGAEAPPQIVRSIELLNREKACDVMIVGRGGGSIEDLWPFNDEGVARAIGASAIPVISAVGHETDFTIADFVADLRAPTPSAAAELAVPVLNELLLGLKRYEQRLHQGFATYLYQQRKRVEALALRSALTRPLDTLRGPRQEVDQWERRLSLAMEKRMEQARQTMAHLTGKLDALSPLGILSRGYSLCRTEEGSLIRQATQVTVGQRVEVLLEEGSLHCRVEEKKES